MYAGKSVYVVNDRGKARGDDLAANTDTNIMMLYSSVNLH